jgi:lysozyme family protein
MSRFDECLPHILKFEGGFVDDPADHGGATNKGITQTVYNDYRQSKGELTESVKDISDFEVSTIYRHEYWDKCQCDNLPVPLDLCVFDASVQHGASRAIKWLQLASGTPPDGLMGEHTLYAVQQFVVDHRTHELVDSYMNTRTAFYAGIIARDPTQQKFEHGWANRMNQLETAIV